MDETAAPDLGAYELAAEALVLVGGLLRERPITDRTTGEDARNLPGRWARDVRKFLTAEEWAAFDMPEPQDYEATRDLLMAAIDPDAEGKLTAQLLDHDLARAYGQKLQQVRSYLADRWPMNSLDTATGTKLFLPSTMEQGAAWALFAVLGNPTRITDELLMGTLQDEQAEAFRECYPELFDRLKQLVSFELQEQQAASEGYSLAWPRERVLRTLLGLGQDVPIVDAARGGQPASAPDAGAPINIDFSSERPRTAEAA